MHDQTLTTHDRDGFRLRGLQVTRLEAFVDAAFAFAVTLLVVSFDALPDSYPALVEALKRGPAFVGAFAVLAMFWSFHANFSRRYGLHDGATLLYGLVLVGLTLLYVYPLRMIMDLATSAMTGGWTPSRLRIGSTDDLRGLYVIYGVGFAAMGALLSAMDWHAWRRRDVLALNPLEVLLTTTVAWAMLLLCVPSMLSIALAMFGPMTGWWIGAPGIVYMLLPVVMPVYGALASRRCRALSMAPA